LTTAAPVAKAAYNGPAATTPIMSLSPTDTEITLTDLGSDYEYAISEINEATQTAPVWQSSNVFSGLTPNTEYKFKARFAETVTTLAGGDSAESTAISTSAFLLSSATVDSIASDTDTGIGIPISEAALTTYSGITTGTLYTISGQATNQTGTALSGIRYTTITVTSTAAPDSSNFKVYQWAAKGADGQSSGAWLDVSANLDWVSSSDGIFKASLSGALNYGATLDGGASTDGPFAFSIANPGTVVIDSVIMDSSGNEISNHLVQTIYETAPAAPSQVVTNLTFTDTDSNPNEIAGNISWTEPSDQTGLTGYAVYFLDNIGTKIGPEISEVTTGTAILAINQGIVIPSGATMIGVFTENNNVENTTGAAITINDYSVPSITGATITGIVAPTTGAAPITVQNLSTTDTTYKITSLTWQNDDGTTATLDASNYFIAGSAYQAQIVLTSAPGYKFPATGFTPNVNTGSPSQGTVAGGNDSGNTLSFIVSFP
jgi:hypothetical protein